ncbi:hypothetical protein CRM22_006296 [Opisthorchis felineus]|uniref:Uncharacterized protein n=1 Tax=Opisthorchis felineus TaxID=147828 RepID=A0A4S2LT44_OPIFE|nr:hypothetical protein CRM22_006296 [Opisthorchis felineus]
MGPGYKTEPQTNSYKKAVNQNADSGVPIEITYTDDRRTSKRPLYQPRLQEVKQQYTSRTALLSSSSLMHIEQPPQSERVSTKAYSGSVKVISSSSKEAHMFKDSMGCSLWSPAEYADSPTSAARYVSRCIVPVIGSHS